MRWFSRPHRRPRSSLLAFAAQQVGEPCAPDPEARVEREGPFDVRSRAHLRLVP